VLILKNKNNKCRNYGYSTIKQLCFVEPLKEDNKTASGIIIPDDAEQKPILGKVIAKSAKVDSIKVGDKVLFTKYSPTEVKIESQEYLVIKDEDILAVLS